MQRVRERSLQKEVTVPDAELNGQVVASIEIPAGKIALRSFEATFTADANCAKMIVGQTDAGAIAKNSGKDFTEMTVAEIEASILKLGASVPCYTHSTVLKRVCQQGYGS